MIKSKYTNDADRAMFEAILNGASVEEALRLSEHTKDAGAEEFPLEFFNK